MAEKCYNCSSTDLQPAFDAKRCLFCGAWTRNDQDARVHDLTNGDLTYTYTGGPDAG
jgi:hypothetical protein